MGTAVTPGTGLGFDDPSGGATETLNATLIEGNATIDKDIVVTNSTALQIGTAAGNNLKYDSGVVLEAKSSGSQTLFLDSNGTLTINAGGLGANFTTDILFGATNKVTYVADNLSILNVAVGGNSLDVKVPTLTAGSFTQTFQAGKSGDIALTSDTLGGSNQTLTGPRVVTLTAINTLLFSEGTVTHRGAGTTTAYTYKAEDFNGVETFGIRDDGRVSSRNGYWTNDMLFVHATFEGDGGSATGRNTLIGESSPIGLTGVGKNVTTLGYRAGINLTTGADDVIIGANAGAAMNLGGRSVVIGSGAAQLITGTSGQQIHNAVLGYDTLHSAIVASYCTVLGSEAGKNIVDGRGLVCLGAGSGVEIAGTYTEAIAIGRNATITANDQCVFEGVTEFYFGRGVHKDSLATGVFLKATSIKAGNTDVSAASFDTHYDAAAGTGDGDGANHIFRTAPAGAAGSDQNAQVERVIMHSEGDFEIVGIGLGLILTSANGNRHKYTAADSGALIHTDL